jgi:hypothetical protein
LSKPRKRERKRSTRREREREREREKERERGRQKKREKEKKTGEGERDNQCLRGKNFPLRFYNNYSKMTTNADFFGSSEVIEKLRYSTLSKFHQFLNCTSNNMAPISFV